MKIDNNAEIVTFTIRVEIGLFHLETICLKSKTRLVEHFKFSRINNIPNTFAQVLNDILAFRVNAMNILVLLNSAVRR